MSRFLDSVSTIISVFHKHAKEDGDCSNFSRRKMKEFIQREFADVIAKPHDPQTIDKILQFLEWDGDGEIDFNEFLLLVFRVAKACYWYLPKGPSLLQRTTLTTSGKSLREPDFKNRGSRRQLQEEEQQTCESDHHPPCEPELQRDTRVNELETLEETGSHHQQRNTQSRKNAKQSSKPEEPIPQVHEEQSQEPCHQRNSQRRRQPPEPDRRGDVQLCKRGSLQAHEPGVQADERQNQEGPQPEQLADVRSRSQICQPQPLPKRCSSHQSHGPTTTAGLPAYDQKKQRPEDAERGSNNQPHKPESFPEERSRYHLSELEQKALEQSTHQPRETECLDSRHPHQSYVQEPLKLDLRYYEICEPERGIDEKRKNQEHEPECPESERDIHEGQECKEQDDARRKEAIQKRRIDHQRELDLEVYERRSRQTREREERGATTNQGEACERRDCQTREPEDDGRRQRESVRYERTRETAVAAAEADVKVHRVSRELEPCEDAERRDRRRECEEPEDERRVCRGREREEPVRERRIDRQRELDLEVYERRSRQTREREERGATTNQGEACERRDCQTREPEDDGRRQRESVRYERTRETAVAAAEADVKVHRVSRELEPCEDVERRDRRRECEEPEDERRVCRGREREEPVRERRIDRQRELDLEVYERRSRQTREREERGATTNQGEACERRDCQTREPEDDGRRQRESVRYERTRETAVAAAEADVKVHRVSRELEPCEDVERRDRRRECEEPEDERRVCRGREREEPVRERRIDRQRELDLEVYERRSRQTREREERGATTNQGEACERRDCQTREPEDDGRRQRESVRYERTRETAVAAAEADVKVHRVSRELEPCEDAERRDRCRECEEPEDERRVCRGREREEPVRERRIDRQRELDLEVYERRSRQTRESEERGATTNQGEACERRDCQTREPEDDGRRQRESVRYERTRETAVAAAEADVKVHRVSRELEPCEDAERRDRRRECEEPEDERRVCRGREREEPVRERRIDRQRELDLEVYERRSRQTRESEERGATTNQGEACERRDCQTREPEDDGRRQRESVRYERTRETAVAAAEADVKVHRVSRELEPCEDVERRDRRRECEEPEDERRVCRGREREEPVRERRIDRQRELDLEVYERRSRQTREREERGATTNQGEACERRDCQTREPEDDGRRQREPVRYERTRETAVAAAEADVKVHRVSRELEPCEDVERRDRRRECEEPEDERRVCRGREREEPVRERRIDRQRELDLEVYERRSRQTREREERGATTKQGEACERRDCQTREPEDDGRRQREPVRYERTRETAVAAAEADVKVHRVSRELEPCEDVERRDRRRECEEPEDERRVCRGREREEPVRERRIDRQRELDLEVYERRSRQTREREERGATTNQGEACERRDCQTREPEDDGRRQRESVRYERTRETAVAAAEADVKVHRVSRELEPCEDAERRDRCRECEEPEDERRVCRGREREEPVRERRIDRQRELDLEVYERRSRQTREREERGATTNQGEACERRDCQTREPEDDGRRQRESVRYERTRETAVAAAEADVKVHRVSRELEPCEDVERRDRRRECEEPEDERRVCRGREREEPVRERRIDRQRELDLEVYERRSRQTREREERGATTNQGEACERRDCQTREPEDDGRRQRESVRYERTRETAVAAAEADVKVHRVSRELEPCEDAERRDRRRECEEPEDERRVCRGREREEPVRERRIDRQRELDLEVYERRSRQTREREERGATTKQGEACERRDCQTREPEDDGRRQRESVRYERTRETAVAAAEADVKVHRVSRELEPCEDVERRDRRRECEEPEDERRVCRGREREEPVRERRIDRQRELDLEVYERRSRQTREREERGATTNQGEACERRDCQTREPEDDGRRQREPVRYERTRETAVAAAEADVKVHRVSRELEPCEDVERRDRRRECEEPEDERRVCRGREREEPVRERRIDRQRELDLEVYERRSRQTREREERGATTNQGEACERRDCQTREPEDDGRRQREPVRYERTRETAVAAAEADVKVHRVSRELEPCEDVERRDRRRECEEPEDERRVCRGREREEPVRERRIDRQRELDLEVYERRSRQTREREERGATAKQSKTCERSSLQILEEQEREFLHHRQGNDLRCKPRESTPYEPSEDREWRNHRLSHEEEAREPDRCWTHEDEGRRHERCLYQTMEVDNRDLCPSGEQSSVGKMRVRYIPAEPDVRPEVQVIPQSCEPQTIAYLIHVIQNLKDPEGTNYEIICHQPHDLGQPIYVKKCSVSLQPPAVPCDRRNHPEPRPQRDEQETGESKLPRQGGTPASSSQENTGDLNEPQERSETGVKERPHQASASKPDGVKGDPCQAKPKEDRRDSQHLKMPHAEKKDHQPQGDGSKAAREQVPWEPESSCQVRACEDREAKSCPPLPQAPEPREACEPGQRAAEESHPQLSQRDEASNCREGAELPLPEKSRQSWQEEKRSPRQASDAQPQREEEPRLCTK